MYCASRTAPPHTLLLLQSLPLMHAEFPSHPRVRLRVPLSAQVTRRCCAVHHQLIDVRAKLPPSISATHACRAPLPFRAHPRACWPRLPGGRSRRPPTCGPPRCPGGGSSPSRPAPCGPRGPCGCRSWTSSTAQQRCVGGWGAGFWEGCCFEPMPWCGTAVALVLTAQWKPAV